MCDGCFAMPVLWERLGVVAVGHAEWIQHELPHEIAERRTGDVFQELLYDDSAATGVSELSPGHSVDPYAEVVGRRYAIEGLHRRRQVFAGAIPREALTRSDRRCG